VIVVYCLKARDQPEAGRRENEGKMKSEELRTKNFVSVDLRNLKSTTRLTDE
jgi:hypothetical protein